MDLRLATLKKCVNTLPASWQSVYTQM